MKKNLNKEKLDKRNLLQTNEDEENLLLYHFRKYNGKKQPSNKNGYLA